MNSRQFTLLLIVCGAMSLTGSALVSIVWQGPGPVFADTAETLKVTAIELVDAGGALKGRMDSAGDSGPQIELYGAGQSRVILGIDDLGNPECALTNRDGIRQIALGMDDCGGEMIVFDNTDGHMIELYVDEKDYGCIETLNRRGDSNSLLGN